MKRLQHEIILLMVLMMPVMGLFSQNADPAKELGIDAGGLTNFPANQDYMNRNSSMFYVSPYVRVGKHEFSAGIVYPIRTHGIYFSEDKIDPCMGAVAGYKFYVFDVFGRENLFLHYSFQYLRFKGNFETQYTPGGEIYHFTETDMYINNVVGLGYNLFFDTEERFGLYYTLDYVISQKGYQLETPGINNNSWMSQYIWNNISTNFGLSFKLTSFRKEKKK